MSRVYVVGCQKFADEDLQLRWLTVFGSAVTVTSTRSLCRASLHHHVRQLTYFQYGDPDTLADPVNSNLRLFRLVRCQRFPAWWYLEAPGNPVGSVKIQFRYSRRSGHARPPHFLPDAGTCRLHQFFVAFTQALIISHRDRHKCSPISHSGEICAPLAARPHR